MCLPCQASATERAPPVDGKGAFRVPPLLIHMGAKQRLVGKHVLQSQGRGGKWASATLAL